MNLNGFVKWALRQGLGKARGNAVIALLASPIGALLDMALRGQLSAALTQIDAATAPLVKVLNDAEP